MLNESWPAIVVGRRVHRREHVLLWALHGGAGARCGEEYLDFERGQALLIPAGVAHRLFVPPESIVVPLIVPDLGTVTLPARGIVLTLGAEWDDWVLHHFSAWVSPMRSQGYHPEDVIAVVGQAGDGTTAALAMPRSSAANAVAQAHRRDPARALTAEQWAERVGVSVRTLRRQFVAETGMTFAQWRAACRTGAAAQLLLAGASVAWVAPRVGFTTTGLIRAFKRCFGQTPDRWRKQHADTAAPQADPALQLARQCSGLLGAAAVGLEPGFAALVPQVPAAVATPRRLAGAHVLLWAYRGTVRVRIDGHDHVLEEGRAVWMPADSEHAVHVDPGAVALPLSFDAQQAPAAGRDVDPFVIPACGRDALLKHVCANLTAIRPAGYRRTEALDLLRELTAGTRDRARLPNTAAAARVARALLRNPGDQRGSADWAAAVGTSATDLDGCFRRETGMTLRAWRTDVRMHAARELVAGGMAPSAVARRVGYAHLSGFSRAFTRYHGMPPREYQRAA